MGTQFLTQYYNLVCEWKINGINIDNATKDQAKQFNDLQKKALEQSGLSCNELSLIMRCRTNNIFTKVNVYAWRLIS